MRIPMTWVRTLLGFGILLMCMWMGGTPVKAQKGVTPNATCLYSPCKGNSVILNGQTCLFTSTNSAWCCEAASNIDCAFDGSKYGSINCSGTLVGVVPTTNCNYTYNSCSNAPAPQQQ